MGHITCLLLHTSHEVWSLLSTWMSCVKMGELIEMPFGICRNSYSGLHMYCIIITHTYTTVLWLFGFCPGQPGWAGTRRNIHPLTLIVVINHPYLLSPSTRIHGILPIQSTCFTVFSTISVQVFFDLLLGLAPSTSFSIHFFTQSLSAFRNTCPYHRYLFCCSTEIMSSNTEILLCVGKNIFTPWWILYDNKIATGGLISACNSPWGDFPTGDFISWQPGCLDAMAEYVTFCTWNKCLFLQIFRISPRWFWTWLYLRKANEM